MKVLLALFFVGLASAAFVDVLDEASEDVVLDFLRGMESSPSLIEHLGFEYADEADQIENDIKTELGKALKESLDAVLDKIRQTVDQGKAVGQELVDKAKDIANRLKEMGLDAGSKAKDLLERIKQRAQEWLRKLLEKFGIGKRGLTDLIQGLVGQLDVLSIFRSLKEKLAEKVDVKGIVAYITKVFAQHYGVIGGLIRTLKDEGVDALKRLISKLIPSADGSYSLAEVWENIKNFFKDLGLQMKEKFGQFAVWLKNTVNEGITNVKDKAENLKRIAKEVLSHSATLSKEAAREALEFFRPYKEDLGGLWDELRETVRRVIGINVAF